MRLLHYQLRQKAIYTASITIEIVIHHMLMLITLAFFRVLTCHICWYYLDVETLTHNRRMRDINRPILVVAILLLVLSTAVSRITLYIQCHLSST